jgi:hypothetical protein
MVGIPRVGTGEPGGHASPSGPPGPTRTPQAGKLEQRIAAAAHTALAARGFVTPIDVLLGIGWLQAAQVEQWRRGRIPYLERVATANLNKLGTALRLLRRWAQLNQLTASQTVYVAWTRDRHRLRFSATGRDDVERAYRTHWISPSLRDAKPSRVRH